MKRFAITRLAKWAGSQRRRKARVVSIVEAARMPDCFILSPLQNRSRTEFVRHSMGLCRGEP